MGNDLISMTAAEGRAKVDEILGAVEIRKALQPVIGERAAWHGCEVECQSGLGWWVRLTMFKGSSRPGGWVYLGWTLPEALGLIAAEARELAEREAAQEARERDGGGE